MTIHGLDVLLSQFGNSTHLPIQETQEMQVRFLGWEDPLEEGKATHFSILAWKLSWTEESIIHGVTKSQTQLSN